MYWIDKILGIVWPIVVEISKALSLEEYFKIIAIYLLAFMILSFLINIFKPTKVVGSFLNEFIYILLDIFSFILPLIPVVKYLKQEFPIITQVVSFLLEKHGIADTLRFWFGVLILVCVIYALQKAVIHFVSILLQRFFKDLPLPSLTVSSVRVLEGMLYMVTITMLPFAFLIFANKLEEKPIVLSLPLVMPDGVIPEVWDYVVKGVSRAQENGVSSSPYLLYSLKEYETGDNICTEAESFLPRPNQCASYAGALGIIQFLPETYFRNASRHGVTDSLWNPSAAFEVASYFTSEEVNISLDQSRGEFVEEFSSKGLVWNMDPSGAGKVYDRAIVLRDSAMKKIGEEIVDPIHPPVQGYLWPAPAGSFVTYTWGVPMFYGTNHNGIDIVLPGYPAFNVVAISDGQARYWDGGDCNFGVITLRTSSGESFHYVHMERNSGINIPTTGEWVKVAQGQVLGTVHEGTTTCSTGSHLHLMLVSGSYIGEEEFQR